MAYPTYVHTDASDGKINAGVLHNEIVDDVAITTVLISVNEKAGTITLVFDDTPTGAEQAQCDALVAAHEGGADQGYEIDDDVEASVNKNAVSVNYKTELKDGVSYTPEFIIHDDGPLSGMLEKTNYYRDYVDENNKGTLILTVEEEYIIDSSDTTLFNSGHPATSRTKTWKHVKKSNGQLDDKKKKTKTKLYNTRRKRHIEGLKRRANILEQLVDNAGLAGVLSATFSSQADAHEKLTDLLEEHTDSIGAWREGGRGSVYDDIQNDTVIGWLDDVVVDNGLTQAMCPWMIGMDFRTYIIAKVKGEIK